jgi:AcrR family transcriptional regulator
MSRKPRFDRNDLARAGLRVTRRHGWTALTLASVAAELGVTPMALYRLVADADDLKGIVADNAAVSIQPDAGDEGLIIVLHAWAIRAHAHLIKLPGLTTYVMHEWTELPTWLGIIESFLAVAERETLTGEPAVHTVNAVFAYVLARVQLRESITAQRRLRPMRVAPERYPHIYANRRDFRTACTDIAFQFGLDALTSGLQPHVPDHRRD